MSYVFIKEDFFRFIKSFSYYSFLITNVGCLKFSSLVLLKTNISSRYTTTNFPMKSFNISFISLIKVIFFRFINNFSCCNFSITDVRCLKCSLFVLLKISMSSIYTMTNLPMKYFNTSFTNLINVLHAFVNPNGMTHHLNKPSFVLNFVFHSCPSLVLI